MLLLGQLLLQPAHLVLQLAVPLLTAAGISRLPRTRGSAPDLIVQVPADVDFKAVLVVLQVRQAAVGNTDFILKQADLILT